MKTDVTQMGQKINDKSEQQPQEVASLLKRIMSNPGGATLEQIEGNHAPQTGQQASLPTSQQVSHVYNGPVQSPDTALKRTLNILPTVPSAPTQSK